MNTSGDKDAQPGAQAEVLTGPIHEPIVLNDESFEETVINAKLPIVVDFWAPWCKPCLAIAPALHALAEEFSARLLVAKINCDEHTVWKDKLGVSGIPHLLFFHQGEVVKRHVGAAPRAQLRAVFEEFLAQVAPAPDELNEAARAELDEIMAAALTRKDERGTAASAVYQEKIKPAMDEFAAIRSEFLARMATRLEGEQAALAARGAQGEFDEPIYKLFVALRPAMDEPQFQDLQERQEAAVKLANSPEFEPDKQAFFAEVEAADEEYDNTVETARARLLEASRASRQTGR